MRRMNYTSSLIVAMLVTCFAFAQDFSNKGKDFWIGYGNHVRMFNSGNAEKMQLYITSDVATTGQVVIASVGFNQSFSVTPNQITTIDIPRSAALMDQGLYNHGIHVTAQAPVVVYSFIYVNAISGATLCLPTATLGKDYYSVNFTQRANEPNCHSYFFVIAADTGTTTVEITPSADTKAGQLAGVPFAVNLTQGQIYQVLGKVSGDSGVDLTGSRIRSISTGAGGCKRIAVYSGSGKISIGCPNAGSSDNLYQQMYPTSTWGKNYITVPGLVNTTNFYRIIKSDPSATVRLNGSVIGAASFINNFYYQFSGSTPNVIVSDKPILVAQYFTTQGCSGNPGGPPNSTGSDPEMIYLNPVEQTIDKVTLNSMQPSSGTAITSHYLNVVLKNNAAAINSFRIDGAPYTSFTPVPADPAYAYARITTTKGTHNISCDTGFNITAYGFGGAESYGYSGGTNLKDLYQFVSIQNQYGTVDFPATCKNSPFYFSMTFPYQPTQIKWQFNGLFPDITDNTPVFDSTWNVNGKQLYRYKLTAPYSLTVTGTFPIKVLAKNPTSDGCSGEQEINYDLQVFERPVADFNFSTSGCVSDSVHFLDNSVTSGRAGTRWSWDFSDGISALRNPAHLFKAAGNLNVKFSMITDIGCLSDTVTKTVTLTQPPLARFGISAPACLGKTISFTDSSSSASSALVKWFWDFGDGTTPVTSTTNAVQTHSYQNAGVYTITLKVETASGCQSTVFSKTLTVHPNPVADFKFGNACLPTGAMQFTNSSTISDATQAQFTYQWSFGDLGSSTQQNPTHNYGATGPYSVKLVVGSGAGCMDSSTKTVTTVYAQPQAAFSAPVERCLGTAANFSDQSTVPNSSLNQWQWDFGDGTASGQQNPSHTYATAGTYTVTLTGTSAIGCGSTTATKTLVVNPLPTSNFSFSALDCETKDITITDASVANAGTLTKWTWDLGDGTQLVKTGSAPFTHVFAQAKTYTISLQVETDKGCVSSVRIQPLVVHALPLAGFTMPDNCLTDPFSQFTDTSSIADGTQSQFSYAWDFGDANAGGANQNTSAQKNPKHKYTAVGSYNVSLTVTSVNGCTASVVQSFFVNGALPQSQVAVNGGTQHCSNRTVSITNNSSVDVGRVVRLEIQWDYVNDPAKVETFSYPTAGAIFNHDYPEFFTPATKNYVIRITAYSGDNCSSTSTQPIVVKATPQIQFDALPSVCADSTAFGISQASVLNGLAGAGSYTGPGVSAAGTFDPRVAGVGTSTLRFTYLAQNGCTNFKEQTIKVFPVPVVDAGPDRYVLEGGTAVLQGTATGNGISYQWTPSIGLNNPVIAQPLVSTPTDMTYTLQVRSSDGCRQSDEVSVKILKAPSIPNTFSPNGDGINDRWEIKYLETYPGATVEIYNRYGQLVFQSVGYGKSWDGTYKGNALPAGTYYYIINPKNGRKQMAGFVDIIR